MIKELADLTLAWAPTGSDPRLTGVGARTPGPMTWLQYQDRMEARIQAMIEALGQEEARLAISAAMPRESDFLTDSPAIWPGSLLEAGELVQARLAESLGGVQWPVPVKGPAKPEVLRAVKTTGLTEWLSLAVPREPEMM